MINDILWRAFENTGNIDLYVLASHVSRRERHARGVEKALNRSRVKYGIYRNPGDNY